MWVTLRLNPLRVVQLLLHSPSPFIAHLRLAHVVHKIGVHRRRIHDGRTERVDQAFICHFTYLSVFLVLFRLLIWWTFLHPTQIWSTFAVITFLWLILTFRSLFLQETKLRCQSSYLFDLVENLFLSTFRFAQWFFQIRLYFQHCSYNLTEFLLYDLVVSNLLHFLGFGDLDHSWNGLSQMLDMLAILAKLRALPCWLLNLLLVKQLIKGVKLILKQDLYSFLHLTQIFRHNLINTLL